MVAITVDILKIAFRKLLSATYYDKSDMAMRHRVASFVKSLSSDDEEERIFNNILSVATGQNDELLVKWLQDISLTYYPKKVVDGEGREDEHVITNVPPKQMRVDRLLVKASIPVELCILDVAWLLLYGYKVDSKLGNCAYGNRMDLVPNVSGVRNGNALFRKYQNQYKYWWENGIMAANKHLKESEDVTIINFDITNCYHSIDFSFDDFLTYYHSQWPEDAIRENTLTKVVIRIYQRYWEITSSSDVDVFKRGNQGKHPMPLSLQSAHVLANWYISPLDDFIVKQYQPLYYGRYVDDCMVVVKTQSSEGSVEECVQKELRGLLRFDEKTASFAFTGDASYERLKTFELQQEKLYIYRFNCLLPQSSLEAFVEGQKERSSEFRFLTDDVDTGNVNLEFVTLVNTLDAEEEPGRRFAILEENRYKLSVYLAKLTARLAKYGKAYEHYEEVEKVFRYFKDGLLIKHYQLWEKLMTVFVLAGRKDYVDDFVKSARKQIQSMTVKPGLFEKNEDEGRKQLASDLMFHLEQSFVMAMSLYKENDAIDTIYIDTFMVRMHYNQLPLQEFGDKFETIGVRLQMNQLVLREQLFEYKWMPYYVKYYAIVSALSIGEVYHPEVFERAFDIYCRLNHVGHFFDWMAFCRMPQNDDTVTEFNVDLAREPLYDDQRTVSVVDMDIQDEDAGKVIESYGMVDAAKVAVFDNILDQVTKIYKTDIFVLPELSLPIYELMGYCLYSSRHERAFVSGMEYVVKGDTVYNYIITCLPITIYGQRDAIPVIRLKNHYAPVELKDIINKKGKKVPPETTVWQNLYHWHGHVFTSYYCYELASIKERSFFYSKIDAMYCPVFNRDTYYFNNIAESMARDMHCYFILCNVSHYGDSRVTKPGSHMMMNIMKDKGGNTIDNKAVVLSATLDVDGLRAFQKLTLSQQKEQEKNTGYKKTPPDYDKAMVKKRETQRFLFPNEKHYDQFLQNLVEIGMKY